MERRFTLIEGEDYYWEGPVMVFTARFHLKRGYCCGNNCRHCPYGDEAALTVREEAERDDLRSQNV
jgi:hypothetical protein